jgi:1,4-dihydroxy-2-naphthoate octaprenyltransferase
LFFAQAWIIFFGLLIALPACLITVTAKTPAEYILALKLASAAALFYGLSLAGVFFL